MLRNYITYVIQLKDFFKEGTEVIIAESEQAINISSIIHGYKSKGI